MRGLKTITENIVYSVKFRDPKYPRGFVFPAKRLKGAKEPIRVLKPQDLDGPSSRNWRPQIGMAPATQRYNNKKLLETRNYACCFVIFLGRVWTFLDTACWVTTSRGNSSRALTPTCHRRTSPTAEAEATTREVSPLHASPISQRKLAESTDRNNGNNPQITNPLRGRKGRERSSDPIEPIYT